MKYIPNTPALVINDNLVVADLHNGIEFEMYKKGANVPSQTHEKLEKIKRIVEDTHPKKIIILGDLKHNVPITSRQEREEVPHFLSELLEVVDRVIITKGNHDGNIEKLAPRRVEVVDEFIEEHIGYFHGHKKPSKELLSQDLIVCAHTHPAVLLKDIKYNIQQAWIETKVIDSALHSKSEGTSQGLRSDVRVLVVPAFDDSARGRAINNSEPIGPFLKKMIDLDSAEVYLLDGSYLGTLKELRV